MTTLHPITYSEENHRIHISTTNYEIPNVASDVAHIEHTITNHSATGKSETLEVIQNLKSSKLKNHRPVLMRPEFRNALKTGNPFLDRFEDYYINFKEFKLSTEEILSSSLMELYWVNYSNHTIRYADLTPAPFVRCSDYIYNYFTDRYIDFNEEFLNFLRNHPWVVNRDNIKIDDIPYYNAEENYTKMIEFWAIPDQESYSQMTEFREKSERYVNMTELIFGSPGLKNCPDWFGIQPWLKNKI